MKSVFIFPLKKKLNNRCNMCSIKVFHIYGIQMKVVCLFLVSETKNQWARDDPAFVVICSLLLTVATLAYCAA